MNLNWGTFQTGDWLSGLVSTLVAYILFTILQFVLRRNHFLRTIGFPLNLLALALFAIYFLSPQLAGLHLYVLSAMHVTAMFFLTVIGLRAVDIFFFDQLRRWRHKTPIPVVVRDIGRWALSLVVLVILIRYFFEGVNLDVLAVSSIVAGYILGNATKDSLGNLFSGNRNQHRSSLQHRRLGHNGQPHGAGRRHHLAGHPPMDQNHRLCGDSKRRHCPRADHELLTTEWILWFAHQVRCGL